MQLCFAATPPVTQVWSSPGLKEQIPHCCLGDGELAFFSTVEIIAHDRLSEVSRSLVYAKNKSRSLENEIYTSSLLQWNKKKIMSQTTHRLWNEFGLSNTSSL
jgi:hypothetical protein